MEIVVVDIGNFYLKYKGKNMGKVSSKYTTAFNPNPEAFERIEINNQTTFISVGELEREYNKAEKNYLPQLLYSISKATNDNNINLCSLLPVNQLPNKDKIIEELKGKNFSFKVNGKEKTIYIHKVAILPEGYTSYYSLNDVDHKDILIIDIGSRTINFAAFIEGKIEKNFTHKLGTYDLYKVIKEIENAKGNDYIEEDIERLIKRGKIVVDENIYYDFLKQILNVAKGNINIKNYDVVFTGGGSLLLKHYIERNTPAKILEDAEYSNVIGAYNICKKVWG